MLVYNRIDWRQVSNLNKEVNSLPYKTDYERYRNKEFWNFIDEHGGDCEDFAITKRHRLIAELGFPVDSIRLAVAEVDGGGHAVTVIDTSQGTYVLDNNFDEIVPWDDLNYKWLIQQTASGKGWMTIPPPKRKNS